MGSNPTLSANAPSCETNCLPRSWLAAMAPKKFLNFSYLRTEKLFAAIYPLASVELAESTAYQEHHKLHAESRSLKSWKSAIYAD